MRTVCILAMLAIGAWAVQADAAWLQKKSDNEEDRQAATSREEVRFPKDFFVDEIRGEACHHHPSTYNFDWQWKYISELSAHRRSQVQRGRHQPFRQARRAVEAVGEPA